MKVSAGEWSELSKLLDEALDLDPAARATWLDTVTASRPDLAPALRQLLAAHADTATGVLGALPQVDVPDDRAGPAPGAPQAGDPIGPYRLVRLLGAGGMADVWLAERADGLLKREVALKLPRLSRLRRDLAARFAREQAILARLEHAHIARLYDAGVTGDGLPWLAMEYVAGEPIGAYCDRRQLDVAARLRLFGQVLEAVQFAHASLIVHRDLKPSNILVTADGQVRLLDFGIAKLLQEESHAAAAQLTEVAGRALTPDYASPEQVRGEVLTIATDTYSLGVVLFELLTGKRPYRLKAETAAQLELAILEAEPLRASQAIDADAAGACGVPARALARTLAGDLDTILAKALEKDPATRYPTVAAFADDLQRYLDGRPVLAQPPSFAYRARKFLRRNRVAVAAAAAGGLALVALTAVSLWQAKVAREQAAAARTEARRAEAVQGFVLDIFRANSDRQDDPVKARATTARELLDLGTERLKAALQDAPEARAEVMKTLSDMYYQLGLEPQAVAIERERIELLQQLYGGNDVRIAEALVALAAALHATPMRDQILPALERARGILDANGDTRSRLRAELFTRLAQRHQNVSYEKMRDYADEAVRILQEHVSPDEDRMSTALHLAARARVQLGDYAAGEVLYRRSIDELGKSKPVPQVALLQARVALADALIGRQRFDDAIATLREGGDTARTHLGQDDPGALVADSRLAALLHAAGRRDEARRLHEDTLKRMLAAKGGDDTLFVPIVRTDFARSLYTEGRLAEADAQIRRVVEIDRRHYAGSAVLGNVVRILAAIETARGHYTEARALLSEAEAAWQAGTGSAVHPSRTNRLLLDQARLELATGDVAAARARLDRIVAPLDAQSLAMRAEEIERDLLRAQAAQAEGDLVSATPLARAAHDAVVASPLRAWFPALEADASVRRARVELAAGDVETARALAERALALRQAIGSDTSPWAAEAHAVLAASFRAAGNAAKAAEHRGRVRTIVAALGDIGAHFDLAP